MSLKYDLMRKMRIQYKTGYITEMPLEYTFMRRYPPILRDGKPNVKNINYRTLPFVRLYEKAVLKNPLFEDEKVYPAHWQNEPQAMTLARKQYQLMLKGVDEEKAYQEAYSYAKSLESKAYESLIEIQKTIKENQARMPFAMDEDTIDELDEWQEKLEDTPYDNLPLHEKGKLDYFVQVKLLKWSEMERERRNRDPLFVFQFEALRAAMFPTIVADKVKELKSNRSVVRESLAKQFNLSNISELSQKPFYFKDYFNFFHLACEHPNINDWKADDRNALTSWITEVLAARDMRMELTEQEFQDYIDSLRARFFPQFCYPERADKFSLPSLADIKMMLYKNGIGYRDAQGQLFVKRFYRLPALLFPEETLEELPVQDMNKSLAGEQVSNDISEKMSEDDTYVSNEKLMLEHILSSSNEVTNKEKHQDDSDLDSLADDGASSSASMRVELSPEEIAAIQAQPLLELRKDLRRILRRINACDDNDEKKALKERFAPRVYHIANAIAEKADADDEPEAKVDSDFDDLTNYIVNLVNMISDGVAYEDHPYSAFFSESDVKSGNHLALVQSLDGAAKEKLLSSVSDLMRVKKAGVSSKVLKDLKEKYEPKIDGLLETHRKLWLDFVSHSTFDNLPPREEAFDSTYQRRLDVQVLQRAKVAVAYEQKESARREDEWKRRRVETRVLFPTK